MTRINSTMETPAAEDYLLTDPSVDNILAVWELATVAELADGMAWYSDAHALAVRLDPEHVEQSAGVIAVLSPRMSWEENMRLAVRAYADGYASGAMGANCRKADRILSGESADSVVGGPKVRAFWKTISDPTSDAVVIDRHAFDIAVGKATNDKTRAQLTRKGMYEKYAGLYIDAAARLGVSASQVQAVTWVVWRRLKGL